MNPDKLKRLQAQVRTGGKGSVRRKNKKVHRPAGGDEKRLDMELKKLNLAPLAEIQEVNFFTDDDNVIQFKKNLKLQANVQANTFYVTGAPQTRSLHELLPEVYNQMDREKLRQFATQLQPGLAAAMGGGMPGAGEGDDGDNPPELVDTAGAAAGGDDDDDMPELVDASGK